MASITIRGLDDTVKTRLRLRATRHGRSSAEEAREILKAELTEPITHPRNLADSIRRHIDPIGGVDLVLSLREPVRRPPNLTK